VISLVVSKGGIWVVVMKAFSRQFGILKELKYLLFFLGLYFAGSIIFGYFQEPDVKGVVLESAGNIVEQAPFGNEPGLFWFIFSRNLFASAALFLSGLTIIVLFLLLLSQGMLVGIVLFSSERAGLISGAANPLIGILPHGVIEIPAVLIAASLGLRMGLKLALRKKYLPAQPFKSILKSSLIHFLKIVTPLLLIAALVEAFLTPDIMQLWSRERLDSSLGEHLLSGDEIKALGYDYIELDSFSLARYSFWKNLSLHFRKALLNDSVYYRLADNSNFTFYAKAFSLGNGSISVMGVHRFANKEGAQEKMEVQKHIVESFLNSSGLSHSKNNSTYVIYTEEGNWHYSFWVSGDRFYQLYLKGGREDFWKIGALWGKPSHKLQPALMKSSLFL